MLVSLGFLVVMILAGGIVALIADKLGRTLGKKRLTLFGMRPRHTATMITVIAGMLIPLFTIIVVATISAPVRQLLLEGPGAIVQVREKQAEVSRLESQLGGLKGQIDKGKELVHQDDLKLAAREKELAEFSSRAIALQAKAASLEARVSSLTAKTSQLTASYKRAQLALQTANQKTKLANSERVAAEASLKSTETQLTAVKTSFGEIKRQYDDLNKQNGDLLTENNRLINQNAALAEQNDKAKADLATSQSALEKAQLHLDDVQATLREANTELAFATSKNNSNVEITRLKVPIFQIGDELARVSVPAKCSKEEATGLYNNLMQAAIKEATGQGAGPLNPDHPETASLFDRVDDKGQTISAADQEATIIDGISGKDYDLVLVANAYANTFQGEGVPLDIKSYRNPVVYKPNQVVADTRVNGSQTEGQVVDDIVQFLTKIVKPKALKDGMIPISGQEEQFGSVPIPDIVELARQIKDTDRIVRLAALTNTETRAGDPLRLHFRVR